MNLIRIGKRTLNLDLVALIEDGTIPPDEGEARPPADAITVVLATGGNHTFAGGEAVMLRRFLAENSRPLSPALEDEGDFGHDRGPVLAEPSRRVERS